MKAKVTIIVLSLLATCLFVTHPMASNLTKIIGGTAIFLIVDNYGKQINNFINDLAKQNKQDIKAATKVVPIISILDGTAVGAVQVTGDKSKVDKVKSVLQVESNKTFGSPLRIRLMVPVDKKSVKDVSRVEGVGVSAMIDVKL